MPKVNHVKAARQRYETVAVLDENGQPIRVPVTRKDGTQKVTKRGKPVFMARTVEDRTKPKPPEVCGKCHKTIEPGMPYKYIEPRSGPYGGRRMVRCEACPTWNQWEYSSSLSARVAQLQYDAQGIIDAASDWSDESDPESAASEIASMIRELAEEKGESAQNIEDGFGHETQQSQELRDVEDQLNSWADDLEGISWPDFPDEEVDEEDETAVAEHEEKLEEWRSEAAQSLQDAVDGCPL